MVTIGYYQQLLACVVELLHIGPGYSDAGSLKYSVTANRLNKHEM